MKRKWGSVKYRMLAAIFLFFLALAILVFLRYFHRTPARRPPSEAGAIIAPADGTIWQIIPLKGESPLEIPKRFLGQIRTISADVEDAEIVVSIFMSPLDAHVNWSPVDGRIVSIRHTPGSFAFANSWKSFSNEKNEILIQADGCKLKLIQIAGFLARRIDCWVKENQFLSRGEPIGMIRLGSQVSIILPKGVSLMIKTGQKVRGGETILGLIGKAK